MRDRTVLLTLCALTVTTSVCCGARTTPDQCPTPDLSAHAADEDDRALGVYVSCPEGSYHPTRSGSGVIHFGDVALTAFHVVTCATPVGAYVKGGDPVPRVLIQPTSIQVQDADARTYHARIMRYAPADDIAWLLLDADTERQPFHVAEPPAQGFVCFSSGHPQRERRCGRVEASGGRDTGIHFLTPAIPGNSGSGIYDEAGRLVGLVTRCDSEDCADVHSGFGSGLVGSDWRSP